MEDGLRADRIGDRAQVELLVFHRDRQLVRLLSIAKVIQFDCGC